MDFPTRLYHEPDVFQRERSTIFERAWHVIARTDQLAEPGDYVCANIGGFPLFALTDEDGTVTGFRNICRHQQLPVLDNGAGSCEEIRCRYHGWTYGLDGTLIDAPPVVKPADFGTTHYRLSTVPLEVWLDRLVLVHPADSAPPAGPVLGALGAPPLGSQKLAGSKTWSINANWKLVTNAVLAGFGGTVAGESEAGFTLTQDGARLLWAWPGFGLEIQGDDAVALWQIVPRSFRRTELVLQSFGRAAAEPAARAAGAKTDTEAVQSALEDGQSVAAATGGVLGPFQSRVLRALETAEQAAG